MKKDIYFQYLAKLQFQKKLEEHWRSIY